MRQKYLKYIKQFCWGIIIVTVLLVVGDLMNINQYLHLSRNYDWLAYIGTVIAGVGTTLGIYFTFSQSQDIEKNNVKPWVKVTKVNDNSTFDTTCFFFSNKCNKDGIGCPFVIKIENCGSRELTNLKLHESQYDSFYQSAGIDGFISPGLNSRESILVEIYYFYSKNRLEKSNGSSKVENNLFLLFDDCYGNHYYQCFTITYSLKYKKKGLMYDDITVKTSSTSLPLDDNIRDTLHLAKETPRNFNPCSGLK